MTSSLCGDASDRNGQRIEKHFAASDGSAGFVEIVIGRTALLRPGLIQVKNVGGKLAVSWSAKAAGLLQSGHQRVNARIDGNEEGLRGEGLRSAIGAISMKPSGA